VSTQSNAMSEPSLRSRGISAATIPAARLIYWSIRRELCENRAIYIAPVAVACVFLFGFSISAVVILAGLHAAVWLDPAQKLETLHQPYEYAEIAIMATALIVGLFYSVDALYGERRDRSILFWKSLPVSDLSTVLAKASIPIVILPLLTVAITVITEWMMLVISSATLLIRGQAVWTFWSRLPILSMWFGVLFHFLCVHGLWQAPIYGWLLMVSAWARRAPILWAVLPPMAIGFAEKAAFNTTHFGELIGNRFSGGPEGSAIMEHHMAMASGPMLSSAHFFISGGLWIGFAVTAAFLIVAVRLRRYRGPN
jgi:ABC-2 type transport system permease protein